MTEPPVVLGRLDGGERIVAHDVRPGLYRLEWTHEDPLSTFEPRVAEVYLAAGDTRSLVLEVDVTASSGSASFNGLPLEDGWVVFTDDPSDASRATLARVRDGRYTGAIPLGVRRLFATVVPKRDPMPKIDLATGQGVPIELDRRDFGRGHADVAYEAYDIIVHLPEGEDDLTIETEAYVWSGSRWSRERGEPIAVSGTRAVLQLVRVGPFSFKVRSPGVSGWSASRTVSVTRDVEVYIRR